MKIIEKSKQFLSEVQIELGKVNWPDRKSITGSTIVVIITTIVMVVFLWVMDKIFSFMFTAVF